MEERRNKRLYKVVILFLKIIPMLLAFCSVINSTLWLFGIDAGILSFIGGLSLLPLIFLYLTSYAFNFCSYHRMFLHYIAVDNSLSILDYFFNIGIGPGIYLSIAGISLFVVLYLYVKHKKNVRYNKRATVKNSG